MDHGNTIFAQGLRFIPRHEFEALAKRHHRGRALRTASRGSQFVSMAMGQLTGGKSLRDGGETSAHKPIASITWAVRS